MRRKKLKDYKLLIFDVDGTLYFQKALQKDVILDLIAICILHPKNIKDLWIIYKYRKIREAWKCREKESHLSLDEQQYIYLSKEINVSIEQIKAVIKYYMHQRPLQFVEKHKDEYLCNYINQLANTDIKVAVYSDYPVEAKIASLSIIVDKMYCSSDSSINSMKPDKRGIQHILQDMNLQNDEVLMVGDRFEKDGLAAINNSVDYIILPKKKSARKRLYRKWEN